MRVGSLLSQPVRQSGWQRRPIAQTAACWTFLPPPHLLTSSRPIGTRPRHLIGRLEGLSTHILTGDPAGTLFGIAAKHHRDEPVAARGADPSSMRTLRDSLITVCYEHSARGNIVAVRGKGEPRGTEGLCHIRL
jgi:hypothetical protein